MSSIDASNLFAVKGLVAVITGGSSGIGVMMAKALALNGAHKVYIVGRRREMLEATAKESPHGNIIPMVGDVTSKDDLKSIASHVEKEVGYINVLIANSGISGPQSTSINPETSLENFQSALWNQPFEDYTKTFAVNTSAVFFTVVAFLGLLDKGNAKGNLEQKSQVIATSSIGGFNRNVPGGYAYGQSKAAVTALMKQLATQLVPYSIRSNVIAPGLYPSEMSVDLIGNGEFPKSKIPAQRTGTLEDMAGCILFLTSRAGSYCNGNVIVTDGGRLSVMPATY
ncbi:hypothetical protein ACLMJK_000855 [Lecanora helva]